MTLADQIRNLQASASNEMTRAYDYYHDSIVAWDIVRSVVQQGSRFTLTNPITKTVTTEADLVAKSRDYITQQLALTTFQQFVAMFETHFFDFLRLWLCTYPLSLGAKEVPFRTILDAQTVEAVTLHVVNRELYELSYERPKEWFKYLEGRVKLGCPTEDEIERLSEVKASRDIYVHHRGVTNKVYLSKAGSYARAADGQLLDITDQYHQETWDLLCKILNDVLGAATAKAP